MVNLHRQLPNDVHKNSVQEGEYAYRDMVWAATNIIYVDDQSDAVYILEGTCQTAVVIIMASRPVIVIDKLNTSTRNIVVSDNVYCTYIRHHIGDNSAYDDTIHAEHNGTLRIVYVGSHQINLSQSIVAHLYESEAYVDITMIYTACMTAMLNIQTKQHHHAPHTKSSFELRKILDDHASCMYRGAVHIAASAAHSIASQRDYTLFAGSATRAESVPALEVLTNDVQCTHGSALGTFDEQQRWYLQSRGIPTARVDMLLRAAFFLTTLQAISDPFVRAQIVEALGMECIV